MQRKLVALLLIVAVGATLVAVPLYYYPSVIYGSKMLEGNLVFDYLKTWWHKAVRRFFMQFGPAETAQPDTEQAEDYVMPKGTTSGQPQTVYDVVSLMKTQTTEYSARIAAFIQDNGLPNKPTQIDLYIIPENIYLTLVWNGHSLMIHDGWIGDQSCNEYLQVTITSDLMMEMYANQYDTEALRNLVLQGDANGDLSYSVKRLNPDPSDLLILLQTLATAISIVGWIVTIYPLVKKKL